MLDVTLGMAVLLAVGLLFAKIAQLLYLPSVTGYILAGLLLGPSGVALITMDTMGHQLDHFNQMALMLIAFGIGEHIELRRLDRVAKDVGWISVIQALGAFVLVFVSTLCTAMLVNPETGFRSNLVLALLLGAVAVATAPAAILHVVREINARGSLTATLMAVVAVDDGIAIMIFGMAMSAAHQIVGQGEGSAFAAISASISEIGLSLIVGVTTGFLIDWSLNKLHNRGEMLTGGLGLLLLCGELTRMFHLSPLLAGMAAGFTIINRAERDERLFRTINAFEPPIYVLFFTLAGAHLDLSAIGLAGWVGLVYIVVRVLGKYGGTWLGGLISGASPLVRNYLGLALIPQAGVAIGLVFMISSDPELGSWATVITPVVLAGVVLSEIFGPLLAKYTLKKAGEAENEKIPDECGGKSKLACLRWLKSPGGVSLEPWLHEQLHPAGNPRGRVIFGAYHYTTVRGLARIATILAHHYHSLPMSVRVLPKAQITVEKSRKEAFFLPEKDEVQSLGYPLEKEIVYGDPASAIVSAVAHNQAHAVVLGYPLGRTSRSFQKVIGKVAANIRCPLVAVHFAGTLRFNRVIVPYLFPEELEELLPVIQALVESCESRITLLQLLHFDSSRLEVRKGEDALRAWRDDNFFDVQVYCRVEAAESRLESILRESAYHDLILMTATGRHGVKRMFFGSLADSVVHNCAKSVFVVRSPEKAT